MRYIKRIIKRLLGLYVTKKYNIRDISKVNSKPLVRKSVRNIMIQRDIQLSAINMATYSAELGGLGTTNKLAALFSFSHSFDLDLKGNKEKFNFKTLQVRIKTLLVHRLRLNNGTLHN